MPARLTEPWHFYTADVVPQPVSLARALELRQEIEERNHMREAGLVEDDDDLDGFALVNQTVGDETEEAKLKDTLIDGEGDIAMEAQEVSGRRPIKREERMQEKIADDTRCPPRRPLP